MTGLAERERDALLPARAGDEALVAPLEREALELCAEHLFAGSGERPCAARWTYARWKPRTSLTTAWALSFEDGGPERWAVLKRYAGDKAACLAARSKPAPRKPERAAREALVAAQGLHLWCYPADRELPGLARAHELRRTARLVRSLGFLAPWVARARSSGVRPLRYKPERRAVLELDLEVRAVDRDGPGERRTVIARVLPPLAALRVAQAREALAACEAPIPRLLGAEPRTGLFFESWIDGVAFARDSFAHAAEAGEALARLHSSPGVPPSSAPRVEQRALLALFEAAPQLLPSVLAVGFEPEAGPPVWTHGDFHPDQLLRERSSGRLHLVDLDRLGAGSACEDLASWIADHLAARPELEWREAAAPLVDGYARGGHARGRCARGRGLRAADLERARVATARQLVLLAAGALRRLEHGAVRKAEELVALALSISGARGDRR